MRRGAEAGDAGHPVGIALGEAEGECRSPVMADNMHLFGTQMIDQRVHMRCHIFQLIGVNIKRRIGFSGCQAVNCYHAIVGFQRLHLTDEGKPVGRKSMDEKHKVAFSRLDIMQAVSGIFEIGFPEWMVIGAKLVGVHHGRVRPRCVCLRRDQRPGEGARRANDRQHQ